ncbi:sigma-70 family RNA polymerase sigma factor [Yinghuangia seranimata]|uniref:sigma-70 family RNA polymerase sigma factor n=1 Tax=Yinghuangia seranimata TaxID=408067 RepID=UPI00248BA0CB|nr:sigma-70 family RNA polymerase sigma factor [Yinghuangia seranimata]MDI2128242.1 sigma-70 family RNA polymerase sigma factor [Yinghuangia seranimata]
MRLRRRGSAKHAEQHRDDAGLRRLYDRHGGELFAMAVRSLGDAGLAEEAVQETFVRAWRAADRFDERVGSTRTWLFAICRNVVIDLARARSVRPPLAAVDTAEPDAPFDDRALERLMVTMQVEEALRRLSAEHRTVLVQVHLRDRAPADVAAELAVPVGTVRSRVFYALKALRLILEEMGWDDDDLHGW